MADTISAIPRATNIAGKIRLTSGDRELGEICTEKADDNPADRHDGWTSCSQSILEKAGIYPNQLVLPGRTVYVRSDSGNDTLEYQVSFAEVYIIVGLSLAKWM